MTSFSGQGAKFSAASSALLAASHPLQVKSSGAACGKTTRRANQQNLSRPRRKNISLSASGKSLV
jgi:flagellar basal body rod protein FlgC